jgi:hypothetical protein
VLVATSISIKELLWWMLQKAQSSKVPLRLTLALRRLFSNLEEGFLRALIPDLTETFLLPGDVIFQVGAAKP